MSTNTHSSIEFPMGKPKCHFKLLLNITNGLLTIKMFELCIPQRRVKTCFSEEQIKEQTKKLTPFNLNVDSTNNILQLW